MLTCQKYNMLHAEEPGVDDWPLPFQDNSIFLQKVKERMDKCARAQTRICMLVDAAPKLCR